MNDPTPISEQDFEQQVGNRATRATTDVQLTNLEQQMIVLALARLSVQHPRWRPLLSDIAANVHSGALFEQFRGLQIALGSGAVCDQDLPPANTSPHDLQHIEQAIADGTNFTSHLLRLVAKSDPDNRARLKVAFRREVEAYEDWSAAPHRRR
jgi:hypothetical protein